MSAPRISFSAEARRQKCSVDIYVRRTLKLLAVVEKHGLKVLA